MNIYEITENLGSIVFADADTGVIIVWNGSAMLNWMNQDDVSGSRFKNTDARTNYEIKTISNAEIKAREWFKEELAEEGL
jgi:hypothetical protein